MNIQIETITTATGEKLDVIRDIEAVRRLGAKWAVSVKADDIRAMVDDLKELPR